ncbi:hypothetical protein NUACC26_065870 [Scytonema sp. NUACC26]
MGVLARPCYWQARSQNHKAFWEIFFGSPLEDVLKVITEIFKTFDPPKSPLKRGTSESIFPPFLRGASSDLDTTVDFTNILLAKLRFYKV